MAALSATIAAPSAAALSGVRAARVSRARTTDKLVARASRQTSSAAGLVGAVLPLSVAGAAVAEEGAVEIVEVAEVVADAPSALEALDLSALEAEVAAEVAKAEAAVQSVEAAVAAADVGDAVASAVAAAEEAVGKAVVAEKAGAAASADVTAVALDLSEAVADLQDAASAAQAAAAGGTEDVVAALSQAAATIQGAAASVSAAAAELQEAAQPAVTAAQPVVQFLATADPATLAEAALGLITLGYVTPPLAKAAADRVRGYAGDMLPSTVFDCLVAAGNNALVDIRSAEEKADAGVPDLPQPTKLVELEFVAVGDGELQARLRDVNGVEAELTAIEVAALKQLNRGQTLYLLDAAGGAAKLVARELTKRGFSRVFVVQGGCKGWVEAKLRTRPWRPAGLLPSSVEKWGQHGSGSNGRVEVEVTP